MGRRVRRRIKESKLTSIIAAVLCVVLAALIGNSCRNPLGDIVGSPQIKIMIGQTEIPLEDIVDFGDVAGGSSGEPVTIRIMNKGTGELTLTSGVTIEGTDAAMFIIETQPAETIAPDEESDFTIIFQPGGSAGAKTATARIAHNDKLLSGDFVFTVSGISIIGDTTRPTLTITSSAANPTNVSPIPITVSFSEEVTGFTASAVVVGNGTPSNLQTADNITFTVDITPTFDGAVTIYVPAGAAQSASTGQDNIAKDLTINYDGTPPDVAITSDMGDPVITSPFPVTITFTEEVSGFTLGDIVAGNGTAGNLQTSDNAVFTVDITPSVDPVIVTVDVTAGVAVDTAGNTNTSAPQLSVTYDTSVPTVIITSSESGYTDLSPIPITITFNEEVSGFEVGDIDTGNGSAGNLQTADDIAFTADITPTADGLVTVDVPAASAQSVATSFNNAAADQFSIIYDNTAPTGTVTINSGDSHTSDVNVTLALTADAGTGSGVSQMMISNDNGFSGAAWEAFQSPRAWTLNTGDGTKFVYVKFRDGVGKESISYNDSIILDTTDPAAPGTPDLTAADDSGTSDSDDITNRMTGLTFFGTAEPDATVKLYRGAAVLLNTTTADGSGDWSVDASLPAATHGIYATASMPRHLCHSNRRGGKYIAGLDQPDGCGRYRDIAAYHTQSCRRG